MVFVEKFVGGKTEEESPERAKDISTGQRPVKIENKGKGATTTLYSKRLITMRHKIKS